MRGEERQAIPRHDQPTPTDDGSSAMTSSASPVGLVLGSILAPEHLREAARDGEQLGFGQLWMAEDCFYTGGISGAAAVLGATEERWSAIRRC
jgi:hypothetical protein